MSLDIMPKMPHANIGINRVYTQGRKLPTIKHKYYTVYKSSKTYLVLCMRQIQYFWIFWSITLLLYHLFKIRQALFCQILKKWFTSWSTGLNIQKLQILLFFASHIAGILNTVITFRMQNGSIYLGIYFIATIAI